VRQVVIPEWRTWRMRTRTFDGPSDNTGDVLAAIMDVLVPPGSLVPTMAEAAPAGGGWLLCDGSMVAKADFPRLFGIVGGRYGETDTAFQLPDLRGRTVMGAGDGIALMALVGASAVALTVDQLPAHAHAVTDPGHAHTITDPGHAHTITDPGHDHGVAPWSAGEEGLRDAAYAAEPRGGGVAQTGVTVNPAQTGVTVNLAQTGVVVEIEGGGQEVDITPRSIGVNWLVRA
jgi:microcystin-dependent protein